MDWYYYTDEGKKTGPISASALKQLAKCGVIKRNTVIENASGRSQLAGETKGLEFSDEVAPVPIPVPVQIPQATSPGQQETNDFWDAVSTELPTPPQKANTLWKTEWNNSPAHEKHDTPKFPICVEIGVQFGGRINLHVYENKLVIERVGFSNFAIHGLKGNKTLYFSKISTLQLKMAGSMTNGYLQFTIPGGNESRGGIFAAVYDENSVFFSSRYNEIMLALQGYMECKIEGVDPTIALSRLAGLCRKQTHGIHGCLIVMLVICIIMLIPLLYQIRSMWLSDMSDLLDNPMGNYQQNSSHSPPASAAYSSSFTWSKYNSIQSGMSFDDVVAIVGTPTETLADSVATGTQITMYSWEVTDSAGANFNVTFENGKAVSKAQFGLR